METSRVLVFCDPSRIKPDEEPFVRVHDRNTGELITEVDILAILVERVCYELSWRGNPLNWGNTAATYTALRNGTDFFKWARKNMTKVFVTDSYAYAPNGVIFVPYGTKDQRAMWCKHE